MLFTSVIFINDDMSNLPLYKSSALIPRLAAISSLLWSFFNPERVALTTLWGL